MSPSATWPRRLSLEGCFAAASLDTPVASGSATLGDLVPAERTSDQEAAEARVMIGPALRVLGERDRHVVRLATSRASLSGRSVTSWA